MPKIGILCEKPSAARNLASALGGMSGTYAGESYVITNARGHLYELKAPHEQVADDRAEHYKVWRLENLPWDVDEMAWELEPIKGTSDTITAARRTLGSCDEVVIATDVDPSGEGGMIAVNAFLEMGIRPRRWSRMYFTDEAAPSLQKAFTDRKVVPVITELDEYKMATYRSRFDFTSMQWTRIATAMARGSGSDLVLRQGRLKSAMVLLVGDQLKAHNDYVRKPFFQNRFKDENGVTYTDPEEPRFDAQADVPQSYSASDVVRDSATMKRTAPPKLLDLASLSSLLVGRGVKAKETLKVYQAMYEAQVVSYPRTEDRTVTPEQFNELLPLVDTIAGVVGVDTALLTHRQPRGTHVKPQGAHGANRPGLKVPASLDAVEREYGKAGRLIYEALAKNYLAILAADYEYEQQKGHVKDHPSFVGTVNVPKAAGWKAIFDAEAMAAKDDAKDGSAQDGESQEAENSAGLGTRAEPFVFEGANKRPEHPTMRWLMKQLEKRDVGTGATRTSTYSEVTETRSKYPLLVEKGRKVMLAEAGEMSWRLLPGTKIGDLALTEEIYADMKRVAAGQTTAEQELRKVADWIRADMVTMAANADTMRSAMGLEKRTVETLRVDGTWQSPEGPVKVAFKKIWSGHEFTDAEIEALLAGEEITIEATSKAGRPFRATGSLARGEYKGRPYVGFQMKVDDKPTRWSGRDFSADEVSRLLAGEKLELDGFVSARTGKAFGCAVSWDVRNKKIVPDFNAGPGASAPPVSWCSHTFTDDERAQLADGKEIFVKGFTSKAGKKFDAKVSWKKEKGGDRKKIVPSFG